MSGEGLLRKAAAPAFLPGKGDGRNGSKNRPQAFAGGTGALAAGAAALLILRPPCLILESTGLYCGACGVTRMVEELLRGRWEAAFWQNPYMFFVLPLAALWLGGEALCYVRGRPPLWRRRWMLGVLLAAVAAGAVFTVLRNLPGFEMLRPQS